MGFLHFLEGLRFPALDTVMNTITYLGDEIGFLAITIIVFWCIDKRKGYYLFAAGMFGSVFNQWLKLLFRIPRPWVLDPSLTIVEAARAGATGYSFPSGHTTNVVSTWLALGLATKKKWARIVAIVLIVLVPFSRMYLGVHTPLDVGVAWGLAAITVVALYFCFKDEERTGKCMPWVMLVLILAEIGYMIFILTFKFPADVDTTNLESGTKNAYTFAGAILAFTLAYFIDRKKLHFDTKAPFWGQVLKAVLGLGLVVGLKAGLKPVFKLIFGETLIADGLRYFIMVLVAAAVWPLTFPLFQKIGKKKVAAEGEPEAVEEAPTEEAAPQEEI